MIPSEPGEIDSQTKRRPGLRGPSRERHKNKIYSFQRSFKELSKADDVDKSSGWRFGRNNNRKLPETSEFQTNHDSSSESEPDGPMNPGAHLVSRWKSKGRKKLSKSSVKIHGQHRSRKFIIDKAKRKAAR